MKPAIWLFLFVIALSFNAAAQDYVKGGFPLKLFGPGSWTRTGPPSPSSTYSNINDRSILAFGHTVWAGTNGNGVYKSTDDGNTWASSSIGLPPGTDAEHLVGAFPPCNAPRLYIGTVDVNQLYRSIDGGSNWSKINFHKAVPYVDSYTTSLFVADVPLVGCVGFPDQLWVSVDGYSSGIYYSLNDGLDWNPFDAAGLPSKHCQFVTGKQGSPSNDPDLIFAACRSNTSGVGSLYRSLAHSPQWVSINNGLPPNLVASVITASSKDGKRRVYLGLTNLNSNGPVRIFRSDNNGDTWVPAANGLPSDALVKDIAVDVRNSDIAYAALYTNGVYKTFDAGQHWLPVNNSLTSTTVQGISVGEFYTPDPATIHVGTSAGVWSLLDITPPANCSISISDPVRSIPSWGDRTYTVDVTANSGCRWSVVNNSPQWITLTGNTSGMGPSTISFTVHQNTQANPRPGSITIGDQLLTITQAAYSQCEYLPYPTRFYFGATKGNRSFYLNTTDNCSWAASSTVPWITIPPPGAGYGSGYVNFNFQANDYYSGARTGTITIGGQSVTVVQADIGSDPNTQTMTLAVGQGINGSLLPTDRGSPDFYDFYQFNGRAGQRIAVEMSATAFYPYVEVYDAQNPPTPHGSYPPSYSFRYPFSPYSAVAFHTLPNTGVYYINARSIGGIGDYAIRLYDSDSICPPAQLSPGTLNSSLSATDCLDEGGAYADVFTFNGTTGQKVTISASSPMIDPRLYLYNDAGLLIWDDNGGGGTTARIPASGQFSLPTTGLYHLTVTTLKQPKTGDYVLTFTQTRATVRSGARKKKVANSRPR
jgi:hypothetical protein